ncbi:hypothetical protein FOA43_002546 [Brettanomyces nanus]|uniref:Uncharacterized protein n=1 Tax=Eeniella nana TaxID=13502 RepID=A0A875S1E4_EENNA|nr:uncharacterized protein FOA43_002546 [Brettanomyces nanus]QPG75196.1 hypothetical protein FOA43_002546 [Brettanomyces nanus]
MSSNSILKKNLTFLDFLNTTQSGTAHSSVGLSLESFLSSLVFSIIYCLLQILVFTYLRKKYKDFYDPFHKISSGMFTSNFEWLKLLGSLDIESFRLYGLEAYFFLRFLYVLLFLFLTITCVTIPILVPINFLCGANEHERTFISEPDDPSATTNEDVMQGASKGLDLISTSNISPRHTDKYIFQFLLTILIVTWFHIILNSEIEKCIGEKNLELVKTARDPRQKHKLTVIHVDNIPSRQFKTIGDLRHFLGKVPGGTVTNIWNIYDYRHLDSLVNKFKRQRTQLEEFELEVIKRANNAATGSKHALLDKPIILSKDPEWSISIPGLCDRVDTFEYLTDSLNRTRKMIQEIQRSIFSLEKDKGEQLPCGCKVFVRFSNAHTASIMHQMLLSEEMEVMNCILFLTDPHDIIWDNLMNKNQTKVALKIKEALIFMIYILLILCWVVPVAMVGSISQLPYLTALIPTISWLNKLPNFIKGFIAGILPTVILTFLTGFAMQAFQFLSYRINQLTGANNEIHLQQWIFIFLYFHLFIVITISSGFIVVLENIIYNPTSVPSLIAKDLPKASNFFFSFFIYKGLNLFGNTLLQFYRFTTEVLVYPRIYDKTPRQLRQRKQKCQTFKPCWGLMYPTFSVYGSIGLVYSVISPLVLLFCCINFLMDLFTYKYLLVYVFDKENHSETYGKLYPMAWRQLYAGIYSLEIFVMGLLFVVTDENGNNTCLVLGALLIVIICLTIWAHMSVNNKYNRGINSIPYNILKEMGRIDGRPTSSLASPTGMAVRKQFLHPCFSFDPSQESIWLPNDPMKVCESERTHLEACGFKVLLRGCTLDTKGLLNLD